jgi:hypothetical protein
MLDEYISNSNRYPFRLPQTFSSHRLYSLRLSVTLHQLREILKRGSPLIDDPIEPLLWTDGSDDDLVATRNEPLIRRVDEFISRHAHLPAIWTVVIVQLGLDNRGRDLNNVDIRLRVCELAPQAKHEGVQRCFGGGVAG